MRFNNKNVILPPPWVQPTPPGPANDEIFYTSSDENIVTPSRTTSLPTIVSNTYVDGKGIIKFASDLTSIGTRAFSYRASLTSMTIPNSVTSIGDHAFTNCTVLTSIEIPNNVASIEESGFANCTSLTSATIPNSVTSIGGWAFDGCSSLITILYTGTIAQWNAITKSGAWNNSVPATVVHCTDGDVSL